MLATVSAKTADETKNAKEKNNSENPKTNSTL
jgi:hypothetical protein